MTPMLRLGLAIAVVVLVLDQATKWVILGLLRDAPGPIEVTAFFNLTLVWNTGVSFGFLAGSADTMRWILVGLAVAVSVGLAFWLARLERRLPAIGLGVIIGGALGNALDRVLYGAVADFLDLHLFGYHFWTFNIADSGISIGVVLLLVDSLFGAQAKPAARAAERRGNRP